jgi:hypothetical protein
MIIASIRIRNDTNDVLDEVEKLIFYVSTLQCIMFRNIRIILFCFFDRLISIIWKWFTYSKIDICFFDM